MTKSGCNNRQRWGCIYKLTNKNNGKYYFGKTVNFKKRMKAHKWYAKKGKTYLARAINKHGWDNFQKEILIDDVPEEDLDNLEQSYIEIYDSIDHTKGYNLTRGGEGNSGWVPSLDWRRKKSEGKKKHNGIGKGSVTFCKKTKKWKATSSQYDTKLYVGQYDSKEKAEHALTAFNVSGEKIESDYNEHEQQHGSVFFVQRLKKWQTSIDWTENGKQKKKIIGTYLSKGKAREALKLYVKNGEILLSDTRPKRNAGKGRISFSRGKYRVSITESYQTHNIGSFETKIEAENAIKKFIETGERALKFKRSQQKGNISKRKSGRFRARYKQINIGTFKTREEARSALDEFLEKSV